MEKIIDFTKSLFSPKALLGFIVGIAIGFVTIKVIKIARSNIHVGEIFGAALVALYFLLYCSQVGLRLSRLAKFSITFLVVFILSLDTLSLIRLPILLLVGGGEKKNFPPFDTYSYMISYGIVCVFVGGLVEVVWGIKPENNK